MKYIIDVPDTDDYKIYSPLNGLELGLPWKIMDKTYTLPTRIKLEPYTELDRKAIEDEVWEFVDFLENKLKASDYDDIFDDNSPHEKYTYQEAKAKYEAWLKQKDKICVGDEVIHNGEIKTVLGVLLGVLTLYDSDGFIYYINEFDVKKTGKHHGEVAELLKKMKENGEI